ncbi:hypothetical protein PT974_04995 [Cladobotryum mycophilum]|uniref:F-box domain-containing protein n=1 Tax=Cladobotryum mycophilum TaxID=491253 RepID=A0ABR0SQY3_9HYPO
MSKELKLLDLFGIYPIAEVLSRHFTFADIYRLRCVSRSFRDAVKSLEETRLNINIFLKDFVDDCDEFRYALGKNDAILIGLFVISFLTSSNPRAFYLEVMVEQGSRADAFVKHLQTRERYKKSTKKDSTGVTYQRVASTTMGIRVITTKHLPILERLWTCYTTAELSFMTWNKVYTLFPQETIGRHKLWPLRELDDYLGRLLVYLGTQGWTSRDIVWPDLNSDPIFRSSCRRVGDQYSFIKPLSPVLSYCRGIAPDSVIGNAAFDVVDSRRVNPDAPQTSPSRVERAYGVYTDVAELKSPSLKYRYTAGLDTSAGSWQVFLEKHLRRWTLTELYKMKKEKQHRDLTAPLPSNFEVPASWNYADDQMAIWHQSWLA